MKNGKDKFLLSQSASIKLERSGPYFLERQTRTRFEGKGERGEREKERKRVLGI